MCEVGVVLFVVLGFGGLIVLVVVFVCVVFGCVGIEISYFVIFVRREFV